MLTASKRSKKKQKEAKRSNHLELLCSLLPNCSLFYYHIMLTASKRSKKKQKEAKRSNHLEILCSLLPNCFLFYYHIMLTASKRSKKEANCFQKKQKEAKRSKSEAKRSNQIILALFHFFKYWLYFGTSKMPEIVQVGIHDFFDFLLVKENLPLFLDVKKVQEVKRKMKISHLFM